MNQRIAVHDPRGYPPKVTGKRLAARPESLNGKLVGLVDCLFDNSDVFLEQLRLWLADNLPGVRTKVYKPKASWTDDPEMRALIAQEADAAILGVGL